MYKGYKVGGILKDIIKKINKGSVEIMYKGHKVEGILKVIIKYNLQTIACRIRYIS